MSNKPVSTTAVVVGVVTAFCFTTAAVVALVVAAPEGTDVSAVVSTLLASLAAAIGVLATLVKVEKVDAQLERTDAKVTDLTNGLMDAKIRAAVADVLRPDFVDPQVHPQLEEDRTRRETGSTA